jgi:hypothetical protein
VYSPRSLSPQWHGVPGHGRERWHHTTQHSVCRESFPPCRVFASSARLRQEVREQQWGVQRASVQNWPLVMCVVPSKSTADLRWRTI